MKNLLIYNKHLVIKIFLMLLVFIVILAFAYFKTANLVSGPTINIISPTNAMTYQDNFIEIKGSAQRIAKIYLNNRQIFTDTEGYFREPLILFPGYNILTLRAEDKFGREVIKKLHIVHTPEEKAPLFIQDYTSTTSQALSTTSPSMGTI
ncbi:MAG: hypothetical protein WDZ73_01860 [Candidatus Paceibacterota bacterium]